jgi:hypothetical protein
VQHNGFSSLQSKDEQSLRCPSSISFFGQVIIESLSIVSHAPIVARTLQCHARSHLNRCDPSCRVHFLTHDVKLIRSVLSRRNFVPLSKIFRKMADRITSRRWRPSFSRLITAHAEAHAAAPLQLLWLFCRNSRSQIIYTTALFVSSRPATCSDRMTSQSRPWTWMKRNWRWSIYVLRKALQLHTHCHHFNICPRWQKLCRPRWQTSIWQEVWCIFTLTVCLEILRQRDESVLEADARTTLSRSLLHLSLHLLY